MEVTSLLEGQRYIVAGNTIDESKYACRIKKALEATGRQVFAVGKEHKDIDECPWEDADVLVLCINPALGKGLVEGCHKPIKATVIQPGAGSDEVKAALDAKGIEHVDGCVLRGLEARGEYVFPE